MSENNEDKLTNEEKEPQQAGIVPEHDHAG
jgi:hypothetical protein